MPGYRAIIRLADRLRSSGNASGGSGHSVIQSIGRDDLEPLNGLADPIEDTGLVSSSSAPALPLIELRRVTVQRGDNIALRDLSLTIGAGEHVAILGPNGCGKSTLIKTITRECYPLAQPGSSVAILGHRTWDVFDLRRLLGIVSNDLMTQCTRDVTGFDVVLSGFFSSIGIGPNHVVTDDMREKAVAALELLDAAHLAEKPVDEMSSGEARRMMIGRALVHVPKALLLDEPSTSLDLFAQHELRETVRKLAQSGIGILLVTHHLSDIVPEIERVILMRNGQIDADGPKRELLTANRLRELFRVDVQLAERGGYYHLW
jgi:iron complex transport system ATP-binding protein